MPSPIVEAVTLPGSWMALSLLAFTTAGDAADGLVFGWTMAALQKWTLIYLALSSLGFVAVWVIGALRR